MEKRKEFRRRLLVEKQRLRLRLHEQAKRFGILRGVQNRVEWLASGTKLFEKM